MLSMLKSYESLNTVQGWGGGVSVREEGEVSAGEGSGGYQCGGGQWCVCVSVGRSVQGGGQHGEVSSLLRGTEVESRCSLPHQLPLLRDSTQQSQDCTHTRNHQFSC